MIIPATFIEKLNKINFNEVSIGYTTITIYPSDSLEDMQITGIDYLSDKFIVFGNEDVCGDLLCVDTSNNSLPVYLVPLDNEIDSECISISFDNFINILHLLRDISIGRENPVKLERNPVPKNIEQNFINYIIMQNPDCEIQYWEELFES
jgi:hypothetical protein